MPRKKTQCDSGSSVPMIIIIIACLSAGFIFGIASSQTLFSSMGVGSYKDGYSAAKNDLIKSGVALGVSLETLRGEVSEIKDKKVIFKADLSDNPFLPAGSEIRTAVITDQTVVRLKKAKTDKEVIQGREEAEEALGQIEEKFSELEYQMADCDFTGSGSSTERCISLREQKEKSMDEYSEIMTSKMGLYKDFEGDMIEMKGKIRIIVRAAEDITEKTEFEALEIELIEEADAEDQAEELPL
jgi:hypothetical protein